MMTLAGETRLAASVVAPIVALTLALAGAACKEQADPPRRHAPMPAIITAHAGTPTYTDPSANSTACGRLRRDLVGIVRLTSPGGWVAVDTDLYAVAAEGVPACLRRPYVWFQALTPAKRNTSMTRINAFGTEETIHAAIRVLRETGAVDFVFGYIWEDGEPPPGTAVVWYAQTRYPDIGHIRAEAEPDANPERGLCKAIAALLRKLGATVTILDAS